MIRRLVWLLSATLVLVCASFCIGCGGQPEEPASSSSALPTSTALTSEEQTYIDRAFSIGKQESKAWDIIHVAANGSGAKLRKTLLRVLDLQSSWLDVDPPSDRVSKVGEYTTAATEVFSKAAVEFAKAVQTRDPAHGHACTRLETRGMNLLLKAAKEANRLAKKYGVEQ